MTAERAKANPGVAIPQGSLQAWAVAARPRSLPVAVSPVLVGATLGFARTGAIDWVAALLVLGCALLMQIITNMQNDVGYTVRGGDSSGTRTGLPRATSSGWLSVRHVRVGILLAALVAVALGSIAAATLAVNNHRDIAHDRLVGRRTFAVTVGEQGSQRLYSLLLLAPFALVPWMALQAEVGMLLLPLALLPAALQLRQDFVRCPRGLAFNALLFRTFRLELWFAALLSAGAVLGRVPSSWAG